MSCAGWWCCMVACSTSTTLAPRPPISSPITCPTAKFRSSKGKRWSGHSGSLTGLLSGFWSCFVYVVLCCKILSEKFCISSVKAGRLLPYLPYQLYAKQKGPLFPGMAPRPTSETAGPSQGLLQPSVHQKLHLLQRSEAFSVLTPHPSHSPLYQDNIQPQSIQQSSATRSTNLQPSHIASRRLNADHKHRSNLHTYPLSKPSPTKYLHKPPQSNLQTPHPNLEHQRAGQSQPQINSSCNSAHSGSEEVEIKKWVILFFFKKIF